MPGAPVNPADLDIRPWREDDAPAMGAAILASLEHLRPWMAWASEEPIPDATRRARIWAWAREAQAGGDETFGVWLDDEVVGGTGLHRRIGAGGLEIGYWVRVDQVRRGIATAIVSRLLDRAFARPSVRYVEIHHDLGNVASGAVPARLGFAHHRDVQRDPIAPADGRTERCWRMERAAWTAAARLTIPPG